MREDRLRLSDYAILILFSLSLFSISLVVRRVLTMHEAVLPQSAREMDAAGDWFVPRSAGRPWLERPPLPQWIIIAFAHAIGRFDAEWIVRLPSALVATISVLLVAGAASRWYGRSVGLLSGLCLATTFEFLRYAWLAEQDIYLCTIVTASLAVFARMEFGQTPAGARGGWFWLWFALLGMTNLAKGLVFGTAMALIPVGTYLLWNRDWAAMRRYAAPWGWLLAVGIAAVWPIAVLIEYPDVAALWRFDLVGRLTGEYTAINEPVWYYWAHLPLVTLPWFPLALAGLAMTAPAAVRQRRSPERFLWCWSLAPLLVFTIPGGKHHHYMLPCLAPWAVFAARGLVSLRSWSLRWPAALKSPLSGAVFVGAPLALAIACVAPLVGAPAWLVGVTLVAVVFVSSLVAPAVHHVRPHVAGMTLFGFIMVIYAGGFVFTAQFVDECRNDTKFFHHVADIMQESGRSVVVNADLASMDVFRILFYTGSYAEPIHNLTFLRDERFDEEKLFVLSRVRDRDKLESLGRVRIVAQSEGARREISPADRFALFELEFNHDVPRLVNDTRVSPMQAMDREPGPDLGGPLAPRVTSVGVPLTQTAN